MLMEVSNNEILQLCFSHFEMQGMLRGGRFPVNGQHQEALQELHRYCIQNKSM